MARASGTSRAATPYRAHDRENVVTEAGDLLEEVGADKTRGTGY